LDFIGPRNLLERNWKRSRPLEREQKRSVCRVRLLGEWATSRLLSSLPGAPTQGGVIPRSHLNFALEVQHGQNCVGASREALPGARDVQKRYLVRSCLEPSG
jgi:hypothetical protein